jgi:hypothetical protein
MNALPLLFVCCRGPGQCDSTWLEDGESCGNCPSDCGPCQFTGRVVRECAQRDTIALTINGAPSYGYVSCVEGDGWCTRPQVIGWGHFFHENQETLRAAVGDSSNKPPHAPLPPSRRTSNTLDILSDIGVPATLAVVGNQAASNAWALSVRT